MKPNKLIKSDALDDFDPPTKPAHLEEPGYPYFIISGYARGNVVDEFYDTVQPFSVDMCRTSAGNDCKWVVHCDNTCSEIAELIQVLKSVPFRTWGIDYMCAKDLSKAPGLYCAGFSNSEWYDNSADKLFAMLCGDSIKSSFGSVPKLKTMVKSARFIAEDENGFVIGEADTYEEAQTFGGRVIDTQSTEDVFQSRKISSSQKGFENVVEGTKYDDYHIDTNGMGILNVENIIEEIESRGNQAVLTVQTSDGSTNHSQFGSKDWKQYKDSVNDAGNTITDVWVTEVDGGSYVRNSRRPIKSERVTFVNPSNGNTFNAWTNGSFYEPDETPMNNSDNIELSKKYSFDELYDLGYEISDVYDPSLFQSAIKSDYNYDTSYEKEFDDMVDEYGWNVNDRFTYMVGIKPEDWTEQDTNTAESYSVEVSGYYILGDREGMVLTGTLQDIYDFCDQYLGIGLVEDYVYPADSFDWEDGEWVTGDFVNSSIDDEWAASKEPIQSGLKDAADAINKPFDIDGDFDSWSDDYTNYDNDYAYTVGGEILRAVNKILYMKNNEGDMIGVGEGKQTCDPAARYIIDVAKGFSMNDQIERMLNGDDYPNDYDHWLGDLIENIEDYLRDHAELFETPNKTDFDDISQGYVSDDADDGYLETVMVEQELDDGGVVVWTMSHSGENMWRCDDVMVDDDVLVGDTFMDGDEIVDEIDSEAEFGTFVRDGLQYSYEALNEPDDDGYYHEWEIKDIVPEDNLCDIGDEVSGDQLINWSNDGYRVYGENDTYISENQLTK